MNLWRKPFLSIVLLTSFSPLHGATISHDFNGGLPDALQLNGDALFIEAPLTFDDFDSAGTPRTFGGSGSHTIESDGGISGNFLILTPPASSQNNRVAYDQSAASIATRMTADFDFAVRRFGTGADGFGVAFLNTAVHGITGAGPEFGEEANVGGSIGFGFDIFGNPENSDPDDNHVSFHANGVRVGPQVSLNNEIDLAIVDFAIPHHGHVEVIWTGPDTAQATIVLTPDVAGVFGGPGTPVVVQQELTGITPYAGRLALDARTGGLIALFAYDNLVSDFGPIDQSGIQLTSGSPGQQGSLVIPNSDGGAVVEWQASFDFRILQGATGESEGFSFGFSRPGDITDVGAEGASTGLAIGFDTNMNSGEISGNHISVRFDGTLLAEIDLGLLNIDLDDGLLHHAEIEFTDQLLLLKLDGQLIQTPIHVGLWQAHGGQFVFGAMTGSGSAFQYVDNLQIEFVSIVPEPASSVTMLLGLVALSRRRRSAKLTSLRS